MQKNQLWIIKIHNAGIFSIFDASQLADAVADKV